MANVRALIDAHFWGQKLSTTQTLQGTAKAVPGEPIPVDGTRPGKAIRIQQLCILRKLFPFGIVPTSYDPRKADSELGPFSVQTLLLRINESFWWLGSFGQVYPKKLVSAVKAQVQRIRAHTDDWDLEDFKEEAKRILDESSLSIGLCSQLSLTPTTSVFVTTERAGAGTKYCSRAMVFHQLPHHNITLEAARPDLYMDHKGGYWDIPVSLSLRCANDVSEYSEPGLQYRFGVQVNKGVPQPSSGDGSNPPLSLMPGLCAKSAVSYQMSLDLWRKKERKIDLVEKTAEGLFWVPSYDIRQKEPHATISGVVGCIATGWFGSKWRFLAPELMEDGNSLSPYVESRSRLSIASFNSLRFSCQHGRFRKKFGDFTRLDARLDSCSRINGSPENVSSPRLNLTFQQQIAEALVFRVDSKYLFSSSTGKYSPQLEDCVYSLNYYLKFLQSGRVVAWYSPKRKEGMVELRVFD